MNAVFLALVMLQQPPSETRQAPGAAAITGRVTDARSGAPIPRAVVFARRMPRGDGTQVVADEEGRYELKGLEPGSYALSVWAGEYLATYARYDSLGSRMLQLKDGDTLERDITLTRALAIEGRVLDELGVPLARVYIGLVKLSTGASMFGGLFLHTDDRGMYRLFGLSPGRYLVCAEPPDSPVFSQSRPPRRSARFVKTCHPSAREEDARAVTLTEADAQGVDIVLQRRPTFTISGTVFDASGQAVEPTALMLWEIERNGSSGSGRQITGSQFAITGVVPGTYFVSAQMGETAPSTVPSELGGVPVEITNEDVGGLVIRMKKAGRARGRITFEDGAPPDLDAKKLSVAPMVTNHVGLHAYAPAAAVEADLTFTLEGVHGAHAVTVNGLPAGWTVRSIRYRNREMLGVATQLDGDPRTDTLDILVTRRTAEISGRVIDAPGARVYVFPADSKRWEAWMRGSASTSDTGSFTVRSLVDGEYLIAAISAADQAAITAARWRSQELHAQLAKIAERITLLENDRRVIDLRVMPIPQEWKR